MVVSVAGHLDVALVSPGRPPRVLHQPVVAAVLVRAVTHYQHLGEVGRVNTLTHLDLDAWSVFGGTDND